MIEHPFIGDWRHIAASLALTAIVGGIALTMAFWP
jgi:hypothetical protein